MATRRDQFQSYQFSVQRVVSALVLRETDPVQSPLRRMSGAAFGSVMIAVLAVGVAGVVGVVSPGGNDRWKKGGSVIVEKESGANYVYLPDAAGDHYLYPVANFASAALLNNSPKKIRVSRGSLVGVPRGPQLGIRDAPHELPDAKRMLGAPWTLCSLPAKTASGEEVPNTALVVGRAKTKGVAIKSTAVLVRDTERDTLHFVWNGHRYEIPPVEEGSVLEALTLRLEPQVRVGTAWLTALPQGRDLAAIRPPGQGQESLVVDGAKIGEIRVVRSGNNEQYYLVGRTKITALTDVQRRIQLADPRTRELSYEGNPPIAEELPAADAAERVALAPGRATDPPADRPEPAEVSSDRSTVCASFTDAGSVPEVAVEAVVAGAKVAPATPSRTSDGTVLADRIQVEPGWGSIVESMVSETTASGYLYLVTDQGKRYAIPNPQVKAALGYSSVPPVQMPASLVARIPAGDALDPAAARAAF